VALAPAALTPRRAKGVLRSGEKRLMSGRGGVRVVARVAPRVRPGFALEDKLGELWKLWMMGFAALTFFG